MAKIMRGKEVAESIVDTCFDLMKQMNPLVTPSLLTIRYGNSPAAISYEKSIKKIAERVGVVHTSYNILEPIDDNEIINNLKKFSLNHHGVLVLKPMPEKIISLIDQSGIMLNANIDVDCMFDEAKGNFYVEPTLCHMPCTAQAVLEIMDYYGINVEGKHIAILGRSDAVGKPLAYALTNMDATVTLCHSQTQHVHTITSNADIIISAIGKAKHIGYYHTNNGQVLIDVGINVDEDGKLCGDIDTDEIRRYTDIEAFTPVPGGVGVVTNYILMRNTICSALGLRFY